MSQQAQSSEIGEARDGSAGTAHAATQTFGLMLLTGVFAAAIVLTLVVFGGEDIATAAVPGVVVAATAWVTWRFDRQWARAVGLVGSVFALGMFFLAFSVFQVFSPIEFILGLTYVIGWFMALIAGIRALIAGRKHKAPNTSGERRTRLVTASVLGLAAVISVVGFLATRTTVSDAEAAGAVVIDMKDFEFTPDLSTVSAGDKLLVRNRDPFAHDFTLEQFGIDVSVGPGSEALVDLSDVQPGTYTYFCSIHSDGTEGMIGTLTVSG